MRHGPDRVTKRLLDDTALTRDVRDLAVLVDHERGCVLRNSLGYPELSGTWSASGCPERTGSCNDTIRDPV